MEKEHVEVILEDIQSKFELVLEGHDTLNRKIDNVAADLAEHKEQTAFLLNRLNEKIDRVENRLSEKIDRVEKTLNERIDRVEKRTGALEHKIDDVEARLSQKIDAVAADLASHRADTEGHQRYRVAEG